MPLVGAFAPLLVALMILLVAIAAWVATEIIARMLGGVPLVGGWIASHVRAFANVLLTGLLADFDAVTADAGWLFASIAAWAWQHMFATSQAIGHVAGIASDALGTAEQALADVASSAGAAVATAVATAEAFTVHEIAATVGTIDSELHTITADIGSTLRSLADTIVSDFDRAEHDIAQVASDAGHSLAVLADDITAIERTLAGDVGSLLTDIQSSLAVAIATAEQDALAAEHAAESVAESLAQAAAAGAVGALDLAAHDLVIGPWAALLPELEAIAAHIPVAVQDVIGLSAVLAESVPVSIPGILSMAIPAIAALGVEVEQCVIPQCDNLSGLTNLFQNLLGDAMWAVLIALLIEAAHDPAAVSQDVQATLLGPAEDILSGIRSLVGI